MRMLSSCAAALLAVVAALSPLNAQRASRPANDWVAVLDAPERIAGLRIPEVVAAMKLRPADTVADLGAGSGPFVVPLATAVGPTGRVYAVEIDRGFFPHITRRVKEAGITTVATVEGDPLDAKLPGPVDVAFLHDVVHHIGDQPAYFKNLAKYLKPTSRIVVIDYHTAQSPHRDDPSLQVSREQASTWLAAIGFTPVEDVPLFADKWFTIFGARQE
jgi:cyclopropane fatty-acyl-phospholipid synthase-like methyltransferase